MYQMSGGGRWGVGVVGVARVVGVGGAVTRGGMLLALM
eukprot:SAG31_NODE_67_length_28318_cov_6.493674_1_plen_38_part_00